MGNAAAKDLPLAPATPSLDERLTRLEAALEALANKPAPIDMRDWPRRCCDAPGCVEIMRAQSAADLPRFCTKHTPPADAPAA